MEVVKLLLQVFLEYLHSLSNSNSLQHGANVHIRDNRGRTAKDLATTPEIAALIPAPEVEEGVVEAPISSDDTDEAPDIWDAAEQGKIEKIHQFIKQGVDVNAVGMWDRTPLHWAALAGWEIPCLEDSMLLQGRPKW